MIKAEILGLNHRAHCSRSGKISLYGPLPGLVGVQFAGGVVGSGCPVGSPVIEDSGHMRNFFRLLDAAEHKVIVLRPVEFSAEPSCLPDQIPLHHQEMTDIIVGPQQIQIKIRLQMGLIMFSTLRGDLVLVRIDDICPLLQDPAGNLIEGVRSQQIIVIQKSDIVSPGHGKSRVGIFRNSQVFRQILIADPVIPVRVLFQNPGHGSVLRAGIDQTQLPVGIALGQKRIQHLPQKFFRRPVGRHGNADGRGLLPFSFSLPGQGLFRCPVSLIPGTVGNFLRFHPLRQPGQKPFQAIMFQIAQPFFYRIGLQFF